LKIQIIPHSEIDKVKWNSCVHYASNGNIFGYKWYLDTIAKEWDGLIEGDYESVLPLFITERADLLQQPSLLREAGIYSISLLSQKRSQAFLEAIPEQYTNIQIQLNEGIQVADHLGFKTQAVENYQLLLLDGFDTISKRYAPETMRLLKNPDQKKLLPSSNVKPEKIAELFKENAPFAKDNEFFFHGYQRIMYNALHRGWGATFGVTDSEKNLLSAAFFIYSQGRVMQLLAASNPKGKIVGAYEYLMDNFLRSHAGRPLVLDFNTTEQYPENFGAKANTFLRLEKGEIEKAKKAKKSWRFW